MPLPSPNSDEDYEDWMERCMSNPTMVDEFPDPSQRYAVCDQRWEDNKSYNPCALYDKIHCEVARALKEYKSKK